MTTIFNGRYTADIEGDFVVFLIGLRINRVRVLRQWLPATNRLSAHGRPPGSASGSPTQQQC